jgi:large subunit ribosomal protein L25
MRSAAAKRLTIYSSTPVARSFTVSEVRLAVEQRTEFGKGAARRTRRAGQIPAVLYGHGEDPRHLALPSIEFARVLRENGNNAVLTLNFGKEDSLALTKTVTVHPLKNYIEHVDLLVVRRGEKVTVDVPVIVEGEAGTSAIAYQEMDSISLEVSAMNIPEHVTVSIDGAEAGTQVHAVDLQLPAGATLVTDGEYLVVNVTQAPTEEDMESEIDTEGAGVVEDASEEEAGQAEESSDSE